MAPERPLEPARRRLPVRRPPGPGAARPPDREALDVPRGRLRVGDLRLARADRDGLRRRRGPEAAAARAAHARDARRLPAAAARARAGGNLFTGLRRRRLLLPRPPRPRGHPDHQPPRLRGPPDRRRHRLRDRARLRPLGTAVLPGDKIISALPDWSGRLWFASTQRRRRHDRPGERRRALAPAGGADRQLVRGRRTRAPSTWSPTRRCTGSRRAPTGLPEVVWREAYENSGVAEAGPGERRVGHDADADGARTSWRSPTTPTR